MKTYEEMAQNALRRIAEYETEQKKRRKAAVRIAAPAVSLCLFAALCFGAVQSGILRRTIAEPPVIAETGGALEASEPAAPIPNPDGRIGLEKEPRIEREKEPEVYPEHPILHPGDEGYIDPGPEPIRELPDDEPNCELPVEAEPAPREAESTEEPGIGEAVPTPVFAEEESEPQPAPRENSQPIPAIDPPVGGFAYRLWNRLIVGGELYAALEGSPDVAVEILAVYRPTTANITSFTYEGRSLAEWAIDAYAVGASPEFMKEYERAYNDYLDTIVMPEFVERLKENQISCERASGRNDALLLTVTAEELKDLPLEPLEYWRFDLASGLSSDAREEPTEPEPDETGFVPVN